MFLTKTDLKVLIGFLMFVLGGISASLPYNIVEDVSDVTIQKLLIPSVMFAAAFSYYAVVVREPKRQVWRIILGLIVFLYMMTLVFLASLQGYLLLWNSGVGRQTNVMISGEVTKLDYPKVKKLLNSYVIEVTPSDREQVLRMIVPTNVYKVGDSFNVQMKKGSLDILYSF